MERSINKIKSEIKELKIEERNTEKILVKNGDIYKP